MVLLFTIPPPPSSTLFSYTTLFRSGWEDRSADRAPPSPSRGTRGRIRPPPIGAPSVCATSSSFPAPGDGEERLEHRSEEHTSELQSRRELVCRLLLEKKKRTPRSTP